MHLPLVITMPTIARFSKKKSTHVVLANDRFNYDRHCPFSEMYLIHTTFRVLVLLASSGNWLSLYSFSVLDATVRSAPENQETNDCITAFNSNFCH
jgi:hypothetical protein